MSYSQLSGCYLTRNPLREMDPVTRGPVDHESSYQKDHPIAAVAEQPEVILNSFRHITDIDPASVG